jgi:hypothetical protein
MGAFIVAGLIEVATLAWCAVVVLADGMSDSQGSGVSPLPPFIIGTTLAVGVASSHWWSW